MTIGVYWFYQLSKDRAVYVGSSVNVVKRLVVHRSFLKGHKHANKRFQNTWNKYGAADFVGSILEETTSENLLVREQFWVDALTPTCNYSGPVDRPSLGRRYVMTDEHRKKISQTRTGMKVTPMTDEHKLKVSLAQKGRKHSEEHKRNQSKALKGHGPSETARRRMGDADVRKKLSDNAKKQWANSEIRKKMTGTTGHICSDATKAKISIASKAMWAARKHSAIDPEQEQPIDCSPVPIKIGQHEPK